MKAIQLEVKDLLAKKGITTAYALSQRASLNHATAKQVFNGTLVQVDLKKTLPKLCEYFEVEPGDILVSGQARASRLDWRPIEGAPKDRQVLLYYAGLGEASVGQWKNEEARYNPTSHWVSGVTKGWPRNKVLLTQPSHFALFDLPGSDFL